MKNGSSQHGACGAFGESVVQVVETAGPTRRNHRNLNGVRYSPRQVEVITTPGSVSIHAGEQDLTRAEIRDNPGPFNGIPVCPLAAAVCINSEIGVRPLVP